MQQFGKNNKSYAKAVYIDEMNLNDFFVIDIREPEEARMARIRGVPNISNPESIFNIAMDCPDKKILLHCKLGMRAAQMGSMLVRNGCNNIYFFDDSFSKFYDKFEIAGEERDCLRIPTIY